MFTTSQPKEIGVFYLDKKKRQNPVTRAILVTTLKVILERIAAINHKMVLTNIVQDAILYLRMKYQHVLKKFPNPNEHPVCLILFPGLQHVALQFLTTVHISGTLTFFV